MDLGLSGRGCRTRGRCRWQSHVWGRLASVMEGGALLRTSAGIKPFYIGYRAWVRSLPFAAHSDGGSGRMQATGYGDRCCRVVASQASPTLNQRRMAVWARMAPQLERSGLRQRLSWAKRARGQSWGWSACADGRRASSLGPDSPQSLRRIQPLTDSVETRSTLALHHTHVRSDPRFIAKPNTSHCILC
jgi:hypothetical protein